MNSSFVKSGLRSDEAAKNARFNELKQKVEEENAVIIDCDECNGQGKHTCTLCGGEGKVLCAGCLGTGYTSVTLSSGTQRFKCIGCGGTGKSTCLWCNATGMQSCLLCAGTGKIEQLSPEGMVKKADNLYASKPNVAILWYKKAANVGNIIAINKLADIYYKNKNYQEAVNWYQKAAEKGDVDVQYKLGSMYEEGGKGIKKDYVQAVYWYQKAAEQNNKPAQHQLGKMYEKGKGVAKDKTQAAYWYQKAAEQNNSKANLPKKNEDTPNNSSTTIEKEDVLGTWNYTLTWPSAPNLSAITGKMTFEVESEDALKGSSILNPNQRFSKGYVFTGAKIIDNIILYSIQTDVPEIIQEYELTVINKNQIKGTVKNVRIKPIDNRPESWDIPASIELTR
jgi:tetratricopeptide (TPR) repeat protein